MSELEKAKILRAWDKHTAENERKKKLMSYSSVAEADYKKTFRDGILSHEGLTKKEKKELLEYAGLDEEI